MSFNFCIWYIYSIYCLLSIQLNFSNWNYGRFQGYSLDSFFCFLRIVLKLFVSNGLTFGLLCIQIISINNQLFVSYWVQANRHTNTHTHTSIFSAYFEMTTSNNGFFYEIIFPIRKTIFDQIKLRPKCIYFRVTYEERQTKKKKRKKENDRKEAD